MIRFEDIQDRVLQHRPGADVELLRRAYVYAARAHRGQVRRSGEPYLVHPLEVAYILADLELDDATVATGLLHDAVEDSQATIEDIEAAFGREIATIVDGVTKLARIDFASPEERQAENIRKMILAMTSDIRVLLVKLADRLHNMRTLEHMPEEKQRRIARETLEIYVPLAHRLGLGRIRAELEELGFQYSEPETFHELQERLEEKRDASDRLIREVRERLRGELERHGIEAEIHGRVKSFYSIWRKMQAQKIDIDQVYDVIAFRIITGTVKECYGALGIVHSLWPPVPGRFKDFIAMPKPNLYQSLHTTVMSDAGYPFEVQIRTHEMHRIAEEGIAAHWRYKEQGKLTDREVAGVQWLRQVLEWQKEVRDSKEFLRYVKIDLYNAEVYVFTPKGRVISLPRGATPIDFAYAIHTEVGHQCVGARVNGRLVPLKTPLESGDLVEIITRPGHQPSRDWLSIARTTRARSKIRAFLRAAEREKAIEVGRSLLEKEMRRLGIAARQVPDEARDEALRKLRLDSPEDLWEALGRGKVTPAQYLDLVVPGREGEARRESLLGRVTDLFRRVKGQDKVLVRGLNDTLVSLARCCNPIPGDAIVGYVTRGRGISVHTEDCPNLESLRVEPDRFIEVDWAVEGGSFPVGLRVVTQDRPGMLARVAEKLESEKINIRHADAGVDEHGRGVIAVVAEVTDRAQLERLMDQLRRIEGVHHVERVSPRDAFTPPGRRRRGRQRPSGPEGGRG